MLKNELKELDRIFSGSQCGNVDQVKLDHCVSQIHKAWENANLSEIQENCLARYFVFHLNSIVQLSNCLSHSSNQETFVILNDRLLGLVDHLSESYPKYFDLDAFAPVTYHIRSVCQLEENINLIRQGFQENKLNPSLKECLTKCLNEMAVTRDEVKYTFRSLVYFKNIILKVSSIDFKDENAENSIISLLTQLNFNHLSFFVFRQTSIRITCDSAEDLEGKLDYLSKQRVQVLSCPVVKDMAYDASWPSIKSMLAQWLQEEILLLEKALNKKTAIKSTISIEKLQMEMSVSHIACLIRLLYEENVFASQNLQFIFKSFANYFQSKRQPVISPGSLSKEFYSIDQHTAARVRDLLQRMVNRINRNFFPMGVVANATILSYLSMR